MPADWLRGIAAVAYAGLTGWPTGVPAGAEAGDESSSTEPRVPSVCACALVGDPAPNVACSTHTRAVSTESTIGRSTVLLCNNAAGNVSDHYTLTLHANVCRSAADHTLRECSISDTRA